MVQIQKQWLSLVNKLSANVEANAVCMKKKEFIQNRLGNNNNNNNHKKDHHVSK
jgi:hypothetical protein